MTTMTFRTRADVEAMTPAASAMRPAAAVPTQGPTVADLLTRYSREVLPTKALSTQALEMLRARYPVALSPKALKKWYGV